MHAYFGLFTKRLLVAFVLQAAGLYGQRCMSFNNHQLLHLAEAIRKFGPLWAHSAFTFQSGNGELVRHVNAAKAVPEQIIERVIMSQELQILLSAPPLPSNILDFCTNILGNPRTEHARRIGAAWMFGTPKDVACLSNQEASCMQAFFGHVPPVQEYLRFSYLGTIFHSEKYRTGKKTAQHLSLRVGTFI